MVLRTVPLWDVWATAVTLRPPSFDTTACVTRRALDPAANRRLWTESAHLTGVTGVALSAAVA